MADVGPVRSYSGGVSLALPGDWVPVTTGDPDTPLVAVEADEGGFRGNLVLTRTPLAGMSFRDWQVGTDELLGRSLRDYLLLDLEKLPVAGRPGGRRLAHYLTDDGEALVLEQWCVVVKRTGWALTATVGVDQYCALAAQLGGCAATLRIGEAGE